MSCVADIYHWMDVNELKINHDKANYAYLPEVPHLSILQYG